MLCPATVANVVCGYDVLGFAIDNPGDEVIVSFNNNNKTVITKIEGDQESYRLMPIKRGWTCGESVLEKIGSNQGVDIELYKRCL